MSVILRTFAVLGLAGALIAPTHAGLFDDDEARKAILDLRQKLEQSNDAHRAKQAELNAQMADQLSQLKRSLLDLNNQIESMRAEIAKMRGQDEQIARDVAELQRKRPGPRPAPQRYANLLPLAVVTWVDRRHPSPNGVPARTAWGAKGVQLSTRQMPRIVA